MSDHWYSDAVERIIYNIGQLDILTLVVLLGIGVVAGAGFMAGKQALNRRAVWHFMLCAVMLSSLGVACYGAATWAGYPRPIKIEDGIRTYDATALKTYLEYREKFEATHAHSYKLWPWPVVMTFMGFAGAVVACITWVVSISDGVKSGGK